MKRLIFVLTAFAGLQAPAIFAQLPTVIYKLEPTSRLWLEGTATIGDYTCEAMIVNGTGLFGITGNSDSNGSNVNVTRNEVSITIPVGNMECGNDAMNVDMFKAMKADSFPTISYELLNAEIIPDSGSRLARHIRTTGTLTIAGVSRVVSFPISVTPLSPTRFHITGSKTLSMHDFGIIPPTALWGLIEAHDELIVRFALYARER